MLTLVLTVLDQTSLLETKEKTFFFLTRISPTLSLACNGILYM